MNMKYFRSFAIVISVFYVSCSYHKNCNKPYISDYLIDHSREKNYNYCELVDKSLNNDINSIKKISLLEFYDGMTYEHGAVIIELIHEIGEEKYLEAIKDISSDEKNKLRVYLTAGFDFTQNPKFRNKDFKTLFRRVSVFLVM